MCGIIGIVSHNNNIFDIIMNGLERLQNRGYDSVGTCLHAGSFLIEKQVSNENKTAITLFNESNLRKKYSEITDKLFISVGMAHSRWATHGGKTIINCHPHVCYRNQFSIIHNGIIENYISIKNYLEENGIYSVSDTDTEIVVNLISYLRITHTMDEIFVCLNKMLKGSWALVILAFEDPSVIYFMKNGSPLLVGWNNEQNTYMLASELSGFDTCIKNYFCLQDGEYGYIIEGMTKHKLHTQFNYQSNHISIDSHQLKPDPFKYWTEKEIYDQPQAIMNAIENRIIQIDNVHKVKFDELYIHHEKLLLIEHIILLGCGTSFNACEIGNKIYRQMKFVKTVDVIDGAEFSHNDIPDIDINKILIIMLSQSGETKDLHRCINICRIKNTKLFIIGIVNVEYSLISREVDVCLYLKANKENAVASTKSFTNQCVLLILLGIYFCQNIKSDINNNINNNNTNYIEYLDGIINLSRNFEQMIEYSRSKVISLANRIYKQEHSFILGKGIAQNIALEAALKIKEISYQHAEGYSASALKHGPFALLDHLVPVMLIISDDSFKTKMDNVHQEIKSRNADVIIITNVYDKDYLENEHCFYLPIKNVLFPLVSIVIFQLLAFNMALIKNHNPDCPRNLAKVVSVE
jgi:glucosamine--fructose-6-phosphate aminotransferase (isomerizing)